MRCLRIVFGVANHEYLAGLKAQKFTCFYQRQRVGLFSFKGIAAKNHLKKPTQTFLLQELLSQVSGFVGQARHWQAQGR
jgi:hypothetical protein